MTAGALLSDEIPGYELISEGLRDLRANRLTTFACLASIAKPWLQRAGVISSHERLEFVSKPEHVLYRLLGDEPGDAYSRYNSLLRRVVSFERELMRRHAVLEKLKS